MSQPSTTARFLTKFKFGPRTFEIRHSDSDDHIFKQIVTTGTFYECDYLQALQTLVPHGSTVIDVGANIGNHSLFFAGVMGCNVVAYEPVAQSRVLLTENVAANGLAPRVQIRAKGVAAYIGKGQWSLNEANNLGSAFLVRSETGDIDLEPLDALEDVDSIKLIKVDVEGMDLEVLQGGRRLIETSRPVIAIEAAARSQFERICEFLEPLRYVVTATHNATASHIFQHFAGRNSLTIHQAAGRSSAMRFIEQSETVQKTSATIRRINSKLTEDSTALANRQATLEAGLSNFHDQVSRFDGAIDSTRRQLLERVTSTDALLGELSDRLQALSSHMDTRIEDLGHRVMQKMEATRATDREAFSTFSSTVQARLSGLSDASTEVAVMLREFCTLGVESIRAELASNAARTIEQLAAFESHMASVIQLEAGDRQEQSETALSALEQRVYVAHSKKIDWILSELIGQSQGHLAELAVLYKAREDEFSRKLSTVSEGVEAFLSRFAATQSQAQSEVVETNRQQFKKLESETASLAMAVFQILQTQDSPMNKLQEHLGGMLSSYEELRVQRGNEITTELRHSSERAMEIEDRIGQLQQTIAQLSADQAACDARLRQEFVGSVATEVNGLAAELQHRLSTVVSGLEDRLVERLIMPMQLATAEVTRPANAAVELALSAGASMERRQRTLETYLRSRLTKAIFRTVADAVNVSISGSHPGAGGPAVERMSYKALSPQHHKDSLSLATNAVQFDSGAAKHFDWSSRATPGLRIEDPRHKRLAEVNAGYYQSIRSSELGTLCDYVDVTLQLELPDTAFGILGYLFIHLSDVPKDKQAAVVVRLIRLYRLRSEDQSITQVAKKLEPRLRALGIDDDDVAVLLRDPNRSEQPNRMWPAGDTLPNPRDKPLHALLQAPRDIEQECRMWNEYLSLFCESKLERIDKQEDSLARFRFRKLPTQTGPRVSVIMSAFNAADTVSYAVESILEQNYRDLELLICDDESADRTLQVLRSFKKRPRVRVFRSERNQGTYNIRNALIRLASGEFITFMDSDDLALPDRICRQVNAMREGTGIDLHVGSWLRVTGSGMPCFFWDGRAERMCIVSSMYRASALMKVGPYLPSRVAADTEHYERARILLGPEKISSTLIGPLVLGLLSTTSLTAQPGLESTLDGSSSTRRQVFIDAASRHRLLGDELFPHEWLVKTMQQHELFKSPSDVIELEDFS